MMEFVFYASERMQKTETEVSLRDNNTSSSLVLQGRMHQRLQFSVSANSLSFL